MTEKAKPDVPRIRLGPIATQLATEEAGGPRYGQEHLEAALERILSADRSETRGAHHDPDPDDLGIQLAEVTASIDALAADITHLRYMIVALNAPDDDLLVREMDRANEAYVSRTQDRLTALGIPEDKRLNAVDILRERLQMDRGYDEPEMEDER